MVFHSFELLSAPLTTQEVMQQSILWPRLGQSLCDPCPTTGIAMLTW